MTFRRLVLLVVVVGVAAMAARPSFDTDTWWHLRAAQWIVDQRDVPHVDPFSSTMAGAPWEYPGWLAQLVMLGFFRTAGLAGLTLFTAILVGVAFLFLWPLLEGPVLLRAAVLLLAAATSAIYWAARPHIASFALAACFLWALEQWRRDARRWTIWLLPPLMVLWVNVHGGFAIGLAILLIYLVGALVETAGAARAVPGSWSEVWHRRRRSLGLLALVFLLCLAATALNPYGPRLLLYPLATVRIPVLQTHILEWQSPDFSSPQTLPFLVMLLLLPISLGASRTPARATEMVLLSCWMALALIAVRNVAVFALAAAPVIARHSAAALETLPRAQAGGPRREARGLNAVIGALLILLGIAWLAVQLGPQRNEAYLRAQVPVAAIAALDKMSPAGNLFNDYNWGGYVLWRLFPKFSTFVDGRTDVFSAEVFDDYLTMWSAQNGWEAALERWDVGTVLLPPEAPLVSALERSGWAVPYEDAQAVILVAPAAP